MRRCLDLASRGIGKVAPNPPVGAVIVHEDRIIGEGWHQRYGADHAEVMAFNSVSKANQALLHKSVLYVSLEPCNHHGQTPPCTNRIIEEKIPVVVIGTLDPNPNVKGQGAQKLSDMGIKIYSHILSDQCDQLIRRFKVHALNRPYFILKWAQSRDGFMGKKDQQIWISTLTTKYLTHKWRSQIDGILVGYRTIDIDNPQLTNRLYGSKSPTRIIIDLNARLPTSKQVMTDGHKTIILTFGPSRTTDLLIYEHIDSSLGFFEQLEHILMSHRLYTVMIEGGRDTIQRFIQENIWHEAWIICADKVLNQGLEAPIIDGTPIQSYDIDTDVIEIQTNIKKR